MILRPFEEKEVGHESQVDSSGFAHRRDGKAEPENGGTAERLGVHPVLLRRPGSLLRFGPGRALPVQADARGTKLLDHLDFAGEEIGVAAWSAGCGIEAGTLSACGCV